MADRSKLMPEGSGPEYNALAMPSQVLTAYEPTWRNRLASFLMGDTRPSPERNRLIQGITGASSVGDSGFGLLDLTPAGIPMQAQEAWRAGDDRGVMMSMFGGPLAKTANRGLLAQAEKMLASGVPRREIWDVTGWFKGVDGKWRFEIDDSASKLTGRARAEADDFNEVGFSNRAFGKEPGALSDAEMEKSWRASALAKAIADNVHKKPRNFEGPLDEFMHHPDAFGAYESLGNVNVKSGVNQKVNDMSGGAYYDPRRPYSNTPEIAISGYNNNAGGRSVALHEMQHAISDIEDFARGGNIHDQMGYSTAKSLRDYELSAGEVEARAVQKRMNLTSDERRARPPWLDYDVPENNQLVRKYR